MILRYYQCCNIQFIPQYNFWLGVTDVFSEALDRKQSQIINNCKIFVYFEFNGESCFVYLKKNVYLFFSESNICWHF